MDFEQEVLFFVGPGFLVDFGVEVVVPALAALFTCALLYLVEVFQFLRDVGPVHDAELLDESPDGLVLLKLGEGLLIRSMIVCPLLG